MISCCFPFPLLLLLFLCPTFGFLLSYLPLILYAEPLPSLLGFLLISSLRIEPCTPSKFKLGLLDSETTNVSQESGKVISKRIALSLSSKAGNPDQGGHHMHMFFPSLKANHSSSPTLLISSRRKIHIKSTSALNG